MTTNLDEPFSTYKNFASCVLANKSKENPAAYCAAIKRRVEEEEEIISIYRAIESLLNIPSATPDSYIVEHVSHILSGLGRTV